VRFVFPAFDWKETCQSQTLAQGDLPPLSDICATILVTPTNGYQLAHAPASLEDLGVLSRSYMRAAKVDKM
jgi:hypothetical protein